jgi:hypothetical protein
MVSGEPVTLSNDPNIEVITTEFVGDSEISIEPVMVDGKYVLIGGYVLYRVRIFNPYDPNASGLDDLTYDEVWVTDNPETHGILMNFRDAAEEHAEAVELQNTGLKGIAAGVAVGLLGLVLPEAAPMLAEMAEGASGVSIFGGFFAADKGQADQIRPFIRGYFAYFGGEGIDGNGLVDAGGVVYRSELSLS